MLPVGPTGYGNSPYSAQSAFAGNPALVDGERLLDDGLLAASDRGRARPTSSCARLSSPSPGAGARTIPIFAASPRRPRSGWTTSRVYRAIKSVQGEVQWTRWPAPLRDRDAEALAQFAATTRREIDFTRFVQWRFFRDWQALRGYAHARGIGLIGDVPIFVAHDSADVWQNRHQFYLDDAGEPTLVAGVPPDYFSATGQRWGNPLYRWAEMRADRVSPGGSRASGRRCARSTPCASITSSASRATGRSRRESRPPMNGRWRPGPGARFFRAVAAALGRAAAHRRGSRRGHAGGRALRERFGFPGIKLLQFAFGTDPQAPSFLPHNYPRARSSTPARTTTTPPPAGSTTSAAARAAPSRRRWSDGRRCATWARPTVTTRATDARSTGT